MARLRDSLYILYAIFSLFVKEAVEAQTLLLVYVASIVQIRKSHSAVNLLILDDRLSLLIVSECTYLQKYHLHSFREAFRFE